VRTDEKARLYKRKTSRIFFLFFVCVLIATYIILLGETIVKARTASASVCSG
jgi:hypothetical protein